MATYRPGRLIEAWHELEDADIPLEPLILRVGANPNAGLTIRQMPTDYKEEVIRELKNCIAYVLPVFIRRDEPGKTIIRNWRLHVPWDDSIEWLEGDRERNADWYTFSPDVPHQYSRKSVLNHRMERVLSRGDIREGLLLAVGKVRPPETYRNGEIIPIRFSILDQWDWEASVTFQLPLVRGHHRATEIPRSKRGPLFSRPDYIAPVEKGEASDPTRSAKKEKRAHAKK
jgi:hypothetical protein